VVKINLLTQAQIDRMAEFRDKWLKIGLCTEPADRPSAERAIIEMYRQGGLEPPRKIIWCGSPLSQGLTRAIILDNNNRDSVGASGRDSVGASVRDSVWASVRDSVRASVWASVRDSVRASVRDSVRDSVGASGRDSVGASVRASVWASVGASVGASVWDSVRDSVGASVRDSVWASVRDSVRASVRDSVGASGRASVGASVRASVWASVWDSVWASVGASVRASVRDSVRDSVGASVYGQHDAAWLSFYDYFREVCTLTQQAEKLSGLWLLAKSSGWALPHQNICWVSERHHILERDDTGRLHCSSGPAVMYPDGWVIYAVHGVRVPSFVIEKPQSITVADVTKEQNTEVRRVMMDVFPLPRFVKESGAETVDLDSTLHNGMRALIRAKVGDDISQWLHVADPSTARTYWLDVPPDVKTCSEANKYLESGLPDFAIQVGRT